MIKFLEILNIIFVNPPPLFYLNDRVVNSFFKERNLISNTTLP